MSLGRFPDPAGLPSCRPCSTMLSVNRTAVSKSVGRKALDAPGEQFSGGTNASSVTRFPDCPAAEGRGVVGVVAGRGLAASGPSQRGGIKPPRISHNPHGVDTFRQLTCPVGGTCGCGGAV